MHRKGIPLDQVRRRRPPACCRWASAAACRCSRCRAAGCCSKRASRRWPVDAQRRELQVERVLRAGAARLAGHAEHVAIDREAQSLVLQQLVGDELSPVAFEATVERFLRAVVFWKAVESQA
jgi:hypothetical protein